MHRLAPYAGNPWELAKPIYHTVKFGGSCIKGSWKPKFTVKARAYDNPIPGWKTRNCGNLRLWDAVPEEELDLDAFNSGRYVESVEAKRKADAIVSVLYPNDATPEGKLLRLEQQYFFVSASIQVCSYSSEWHRLRPFVSAWCIFGMYAIFHSMFCLFSGRLGPLQGQAWQQLGFAAR